MTDLGNGIAEELVFFPCGDEELSGVLTSPSEPNGHVVVVSWGAAAIPSSGPNQLRTRMARSLAADGYHCLRFDYVGMGESSGAYRTPTMTGSYADQIIAASTWLATRGFERVLLLGNCFGAWSSLMAAPSVTDLEGLVLSNPPVRRDHTQVRSAKAPLGWWVRRIKALQLSKLKSSQHRAAYRRLVKGKVTSLVGSETVDTQFVDAVQELFERGVPTLFTHQDDGFGQDLEAELENGLRESIEKGPRPSRAIKLEGHISGNIAAQASLIEAVRYWLRDLHATESRPEPAQLA